LTCEKDDALQSPEMRAEAIVDVELVRQGRKVKGRRRPRRDLIYTTAGAKAVLSNICALLLGSL